jgi:hypothetical protein
MGSIYESQRENFNKVLGYYKDYIKLYKFFNNGSTDGATTFAEFYWRMTFVTRHDGEILKPERGY